MHINWHKFAHPLRYPEYQTDAICLEAVKQYGHALEYVNNQTEDICLAAVKQNGRALKYVNNQTDEICLDALRSTWRTAVYNMINIPVKGNLLKEINKMKLINGPLL